MIRLLAEIWTASGYLCGQRLKAALPHWLPWLKRRATIMPTVERQLVRISARQMDRRLAPFRVRERRRPPLAREVRRTSSAKVFAITGSVGKTSTKDLLRAMVARAWDLDVLAADYTAFIERHAACSATSPEQAFVASVELVDDWRRFPFVDPELPAELLPRDWVGTHAVELFHRRHAEWADAALAWFTA